MSRENSKVLTELFAWRGEGYKNPVKSEALTGYGKPPQAVAFAVSNDYYLAQKLNERNNRDTKLLSR